MLDVFRSNSVDVEKVSKADGREWKKKDRRRKGNVQRCS